MSEIQYRKSTFSGGDCCVEIATPPGRVLVRDTKDRTRPPAAFSSAAWAAFVDSVREREFDR
jgi:hypothetical protein